MSPVCIVLHVPELESTYRSELPRMSASSFNWLGLFSVWDIDLFLCFRLMDHDMETHEVYILCTLCNFVSTFVSVYVVSVWAEGQDAVLGTYSLRMCCSLNLELNLKSSWTWGVQWGVGGAGKVKDRSAYLFAACCLTYWRCFFWIINKRLRGHRDQRGHFLLNVPKFLRFSYHFAFTAEKGVSKLY